MVTYRARGILGLVFPQFTFLYSPVGSLGSPSLSLFLILLVQTVYGELISLESNSDVLGLAMFILQRLLWNPDIAAEFRHTKVPHLYKDGNLRFFH